MKCCIVKDLLPNYIDGLTNEETNEEINAHLDTCADCRAVYEKMTAVTPQEIPAEDKNIDFLKKLKAKMLRRNIIAAAAICIVLLVSFVIFANNYEIPLPFDTYRMSVEFVPHAVVTNEDGKTLWVGLNYVEPDEYSRVINVLTRISRGINGISEMSYGRTIKREGGEVRVVYYYYSKTLWNSLFVDPDLQEYSESGMSTGTDMYGDWFDSADPAPQMIEVYYLPVKELYDKMESLTDEEYDRLRENRMLVWSGII